MKKKTIEDQPYKVGKEFIKWLDAQIVILQAQHCYGRFGVIENEIALEQYAYIRTIVQP